MLRVRQGVNIGELAGGLAQSAQVLGPLPLRHQLLPADEHHIHKARNTRRQEGQLIGAVGAILVQSLQHLAVGEGAQGVQHAVENGQHQRQGGLGVLIVADLLASQAQLVVLPGLHNAQPDNAHTHQGHGCILGRGQQGRPGDDAQHRHHRAGGVANGRRDGKLNVAKPHVSQGHGQNIQQRHRQIGEDDGGINFRPADKDFIGCVQTHDHAHSHDHFQVGVLVVCIPTADFRKQIRSAPEQKRDHRKPKPHK